MKSRWQVDVYVLINCLLDVPDNGSDLSWDPLNNVNCDLGLRPENCTLEFFDSRDSFDSGSGIGVAYMAKLIYQYAGETEQSVQSRVLEDFMKTQFVFEAPSDQIVYDIDFIDAWAFFDLDNPNEDGEGADSDHVDPVNDAFPNLLYGFMLEETSSDEFIGSDGVWYLTDNFMPAMNE
jgi:hypothetical protein